MNCMDFLFSTKLKDVLRSWNLLQAVFIEKKWSYYFFSGYVMYICKMNQPRFALEYHQETDVNDFTHTT